MSLPGRSSDNRQRSSQVKSPVRILDFDLEGEPDGQLVGPKYSPRRQEEVQVLIPIHAQIRVRMLGEFFWD